MADSIVGRPDEFLWVEKYRPQTINDCILPQRLKDTLNEMVAKGEIQNIMAIGGAGQGKCLDGSEVIEVFGSEELIAELTAFLAKKQMPTTFKQLYLENRANFIRMGVFNDNIPDCYINWDAVAHVYSKPKTVTKNWHISTIFKNLPAKNSIEYSWLMGEPYDYYLAKVKSNKVDPRWDWTRVADMHPENGYNIMAILYYNHTVPTFPIFSCNTNSKQYWLDRGWSKEEAVLKRGGK